MEKAFARARIPEKTNGVEAEKNGKIGVLSSPSILPFFSASTPFVFSGILALANAFSIRFFFTESIREKHPDRKIQLLASLDNIARAKKFIDVRGLFLVSFLFNVGFSFFTSFFNVYLTNKFDFSTAEIGNFFAYVGIWIIITQLIVVRYLSKRFNEAELLGPAYVLTGVGLLLYLAPQVWWALLFVVPLASIPNGIQQANFSSLLTKRTEERVRGEVLGINSSLTSLGQSLPPIFAGVIAAATATFVPVILASLIIFANGFIFIYKVKKARE